MKDLSAQIEYIAARNPNAGRRERVSGTHEKVVRGLPYIIAYVVSPEDWPTD